jgi:two-component system sensor histidine kinase BaeS
MRRVLPNRLVVAVALLSVTVSSAFGAFVVLPVNDLADEAHAVAVTERADLAVAVARSGGTPVTPGLTVLAAPGRSVLAGVPSAADWAAAADPRWRRDARRGRTAFAVRAVGDGRLVVVAQARTGAIERRERIGLAIALSTVLVGAMGCALWAGAAHARRLGRVAVVARRIAGGDLTARARDGAGDEVGRLGADVDRMADRLVALERARGEFVAKVSHDLRTPVTVIKGYAFTLARRGGDADTLRRLTAITREADRLTRLIDDLMTLSRAQAGALNLVWHPTAASDLLGEVAERIGGQAAEQRIDVVVECTAFAVDGDRGRLGQVLTNLALNALRQAPPGSTVTLCALADGDDAQLLVSDRGPGIEPARLRELLQPFATGDPTTGTGLGLAIVSEIVTAHGGAFTLEPRPGGGTVARIHLPGAAVRPTVLA